MDTYRMITDKELKTMTKEHLADMYNDAIETIQFMSQRISELMEENDDVWEAYEEVSNKLYG